MPAAVSSASTALSGSVGEQGHPLKITSNRGVGLGD